MSRTRRTPVEKRTKVAIPHEGHRYRRCVNCGEAFPPNEVFMSIDESGYRVGPFCEGCL